MEKMKLSFLLFIIVVFAYSGCIYAQKVKDLEGEYTYMVPSDQNQVEAERIAINRAQVEAIAREFGVLVGNRGITQLNGSGVSYVQLGENEVKAEWIRDNKSPQFEYITDPKTGQHIIKVKVWFKAREIISKAVEVEVNLLRNGTSLKFEDSRYNSGDQMYLRFKAPIDGYLVVYDLDGQYNMHRLLPYSGSRMSSYKIDGNKEYIFFSPKYLYNGERASDVDEILFSAEKNVEYDRICVIFSPNEIVRPADASGKKVEGAKVGISNMSVLTVTRTLSFDRFQKWLSESRLKDIQMRYVPIEIEIHKK